MKTALIRNENPLQSAFTLIELLVVIAIIAILAGLLLPTLARAKLKAKGIQCMNNNHQLSFAWRMYSEENSDYLLLASSSGAGGGAVPGEYVWVTGNLDFTSNPSNWDINKDIVQSPMWPYCNKNAAIWRCPGDRSYVTVNGQQLPRVRTYSMNLFLGGFGGGVGNTDPGGGVFSATTWTVYRKYGDLATPGSSQVFLFIDEREDAINVGNFFTDMAGFKPANGAAYALADYPASYHGDAGGISFCDSHAEIHRWEDGRTMPPLDYEGSINGGGSGSKSTPYDVDVGWLQFRSTAPKF